MLADGTELGIDRENHCRPHASGQGAVIRYRRYGNADEVTVYGWPEGDVGYIKGIAVDGNGDQHRLHLGLSDSAQPRLLWRESDDSYGFYARQTTGNRIVLYGRTSTGQRSGLRVAELITGGGVAITGQCLSHWPLGLDCAFVQVGHKDWVADGAGNF